MTPDTLEKKSALYIRLCNTLDAYLPLIRYTEESTNGHPCVAFLCSAWDGLQGRPESDTEVESAAVCEP